MTRIGNAAAAAAVDDYAAARVEHDDDAEDPVQQLTFRNAVEFQAGVEVLLRNDVCIVATRAEDLEEGKVLDKLGKIVSRPCCLTYCSSFSLTHVPTHSSTNTRNNRISLILISSSSLRRSSSSFATTCAHRSHV